MSDVQPPFISRAQWQQCVYCAEPDYEPGWGCHACGCATTEDVQRADSSDITICAACFQNAHTGQSDETGCQCRCHAAPDQQQRGTSMKPLVLTLLICVAAQAITICALFLDVHHQEHQIQGLQQQATQQQAPPAAPPRWPGPDQPGLTMWGVLR